MENIWRDDMKKEKHKGLVTCNCGTRFVSVFAVYRNERGVSDSTRKIEGFCYCQNCGKIFKIKVDEV
jgi:hypothetical protein